MSKYSINSVELSTFGFMAGRHRGGRVAISGAWDMPARIGKTHNDWGDENGIEPLVSVGEIYFGGRDLSLTGYVRGTDRLTALAQVYSMFETLGVIGGGLLTLESDVYGSWEVYVSGAVTVNRIWQGWCEVTIPFRQPIVDIDAGGQVGIPDEVVLQDGEGTGILDEEGNEIIVGEYNWNGWGIDGISFNNLGLIVTKMERQMDRPAPKSFERVGYRNEPWAVRPTGWRTVTIEALIKQPDLEGFELATGGLARLMAREGLRTITHKGDILRTVFAKDGFVVSRVHNYPGLVYGFVTVQLTEATHQFEWGYLEDSTGLEIETSYGNIII